MLDSYLSRLGRRIAGPFFRSYLARVRCCIRVTTSLNAVPATPTKPLQSPTTPTFPTDPTDEFLIIETTMYKPTYLSLVAALVAVTLVAPAPIRESLFQRRQGVNCTDPNAITSGSCWEELQLAEYLTNWNENRPICTTVDGTPEDGATCCAFNEVWSTCFIRLAMGNHGYNCININEGTCPNFQVGASTSPQVRYILGTMYSESSSGFNITPDPVLTLHIRHQQLL